ncbi:hypothetical protein [Plasmodium yoelii yoelii]|uniref:Uncharacterized protein n=1 Tax=Plasmodium yoelii yoelii TaxID=73239 RepID=Q7R8Y8_PLAYO|nr:hypothetical protein [Plasmodium yoelii yoelii]
MLFSLYFKLSALMIAKIIQICNMTKVYNSTHNGIFYFKMS